MGDSADQLEPSIRTRVVRASVSPRRRGRAPVRDVALEVVTTREALTGRDRQRERTRLRVRDAALDVFRRDGLAAARIDDIVKAARVSRGTFYFHFPTKEDVIVEVLDASEHRVASAIRALPRTAAVREVLETVCLQIASEWEGEPQLFPDVGAVAVRRAAATLRDGQRDPVSLALGDVFRRAVKRKELTPYLPPEVLGDFFLVNAFAAALAWCAQAGRDSATVPLQTVLATVIEIFLNGACTTRHGQGERRTLSPTPLTVASGVREKRRR
jgi:AcrR family transcriptional regulator